MSIVLGVSRNGDKRFFRLCESTLFFFGFPVIWATKLPNQRTKGLDFSAVGKLRNEAISEDLSALQRLLADALSGTVSTAPLMDTRSKIGTKQKTYLILLI